MKQGKIVIGFCSLLSLQIIAANDAVALDGHRIARPTAAEKQSLQNIDEPTISESDASSLKASAKPDDSDNDTTLGSHTHKAAAVLNSQDQAGTVYQESIFDWQRKNLPTQLQGQNGATIDNTGSVRHRGLKSHLASSLGTVVGSVANTYLPIASVAPRGNSEPKIEVIAGHCPAAFDPAFQVPVKWWDILSSEESDHYFGPQWKFWLTAVQNVFQSHARELHETPGVSSLHVIVNPDGSIYGVTPYTGAERGNQGHQINERSMEHLRQIILSLGRFPPFPQGSKVRCYHLIFNGSAGI